MEAINFFFSKLKKKNLLSDGIKNHLLLKILIFKRKKIWFSKRNLRYGYSGNLIDKKIYGKIGLLIIFIKIFYLITAAFFLVFFPSRKNYIKVTFLLLRAYGRFIGLLNYKPKKYI